MTKKPTLMLAIITLFAAFVSTGCLEIIEAPPLDDVSTDTEMVDLSSTARQNVVGIDFLGEVIFETGYSFEETVVGGLSGIVYDAEEDRYYALSDDRSQLNPARFYALTIDIADGELTDGDIAFQSVVTLLDADGQPYVEKSLDPEGLALSPEGTLYVASEGDANAEPPINPFVNEYALTGELFNELPVPEKFLPNGEGTVGIRNNLAFESLTLSPDNHYLYTAVENALAQDGPATNIEQESLVRIIKYDLATETPIQEMVYVANAVPEVPDPPDAFRTNGLVELVALDNNGTFLALERAFSVGKGNTVHLYEAYTQGALDVIAVDDLMWEEEGIPFEIDPPIAKELLLDIADLGITPDNLEGMVLGPQLADGRQTLIIVSDNNFNDTQVTQFIGLALTLEATPVAMPVAETPAIIDEDEVPENAIPGDADDPAIWVHPTDPAQSLILVTVKDGGLVVLDLDGQVLDTILPAEFGEIRYNNVDLIYDFSLSGEAVDLAVVSDRGNDTLAIHTIDPDSLQLTDVTADDIIETIFGVDDGEQTAYGLGTYTSLETGKAYAFVTQRDGNQIAQLELTDNGSGQVAATIVRTLSLPVISEDIEDSQSEGVVVDAELGFVYVAMEDGDGIFKFTAEPEGGNDPEPVLNFNHDSLQPDIEGLTIYFGADGNGYLLVSSQGDSTYAVFDRAGDNAYLGSFVIGDHNGIDQANESDGTHVINVPLGSNYPSGLLVVQDGANDPQFPAEDDEELENHSANFKFVPWENVASAFSPPLMLDTASYSPR